MKVKKAFSVEYDVWEKFAHICRVKAINRSALITSLLEYWVAHQNDAPVVEAMLHDPERD